MGCIHIVLQVKLQKPKNCVCYQGLEETIVEYLRLPFSSPSSKKNPLHAKFREHLFYALG